MRKMGGGDAEAGMTRGERRRRCFGFAGPGFWDGLDCLGGGGGGGRVGAEGIVVMDGCLVLMR